jgi:glycerate 2-kinase
MRVLVAPDSFKESAQAGDVCESLARGLQQGCGSWEVDCCPLADGGEGTIAAIASSLSVRLESVAVTNSMGNVVNATLAWLPRELEDEQETTAVMEAASCLGLGLVPRPERNPQRASSYGLGELIAHAYRQGARTVIVALGGTSTVDVGLGMAQSLGVLVSGVPVPAAGGNLAQGVSIDVGAMRRAFPNLQVLLASDVQNPLLGPRGAAHAFGPQKGASPQVVQELELGAELYARRLFEACAGGKDSSFEQAASQPGAGAAGGLGYALQQLFGAKFASGIGWVMRAVDFERRLAQADLVITGEGRLDATSFEGKVVSGVVQRAAARGIPVCVVCGQSALNDAEWARQGISRVETLLAHAVNEDDAKARVLELLQSVGERIAAEWNPAREM